MLRNIGSAMMRAASSSSSSSSSSSTSAAAAAASGFGVGQLNHVAIAVPDMESARSFYQNVMGVENVSEAVPQPEHGVSTVMVRLPNTTIELIHPYGDKSPISKFLEKNPSGGIHHVCLEVEDIHQAVKHLTETHGLRALNPEPKIGAHGKPIVFLHPKDCHGVLLEVEQK